MNKKILWLIPTLALIVCILYNYTSTFLNINIEIMEFITFIFGVYGILFVAPCFYIYLINKNSYDKIKHILCSVFFVSINAIIANPMSLLFYIGVKKRKHHDLDLFSMYIIVPLIIILVGLFITQILQLIKKGHNGRGQKGT